MPERAGAAINLLAVGATRPFAPSIAARISLPLR